MASTTTRSKSRSSDHDTKTQPKRKSESTHTSPTSPSTSTLKKVLPQLKSIKTKTQTTLTSIIDSKEPVNLTPPYGKHSTKSTGMSIEIKKEKIDEVSKTPNSKLSPIALSSPEEDDLCSNDKYDEAQDETPKQQTECKSQQQITLPVKPTTQQQTLSPEVQNLDAGVEH